MKWLSSSRIRLIAFFGSISAVVAVINTAAPGMGGDRVDESVEPSPWRAPSALCLTPDGSTLYVAGAKSGTLSAIDLRTRAVVWEQRLGRSLADLAITPDGNTLVACDPMADELLIAVRSGDQFRVKFRRPVPGSPTALCLDPSGTYCFVASRWGRTLTSIALTTGDSTAAIGLTFSPHRMVVLPGGGQLAVADAFGGRMALIDLATNRVMRELDIPAHNIRGMTLSADRRQLLITHSILTESAATTRDNVFWGILMTSNMRVIPVSALMDETKNVVREAHTHFFGDPGNAAGDPDALATLSDGTTIVCLAGVGEVAVGHYRPYGFRRLGVGRRPIALAIAPDERTAYVANAHSDTISVIEIPDRAVTETIALGEPQLTLEQEGEQLFYDARLSLDGWFSCHTCHTDGHSNGRRADTFGDGSYGSAKTVMSLMGTGLTDPWAWNGSKSQLEQQIRESMRLTMQPKTGVGERAVAALTAYLRTLEPPPPLPKSDPAAIARGAQIFASRRCTNCHAPPTFSNPHVYDVGLDDGEGGNRHFNPPSLLGVVHKAPYFHDGRAKTLEQVVKKYQHRLRTALADDEAQDLIEFLKSL